jgi:hypothetical protein
MFVLLVLNFAGSPIHPPLGALSAVGGRALQGRLQLDTGCADGGRGNRGCGRERGHEEGEQQLQRPPCGGWDEDARLGGEAGGCGWEGWQLDPWVWIPAGFVPGGYGYG